MGKQIRFDDSARRSLRRGVEQLAAAVRVTLGPRGRTVVIDNGNGMPTITNDGVTIAREIELANPFENLGVQLLRDAAIKTGESAGDGTTTATVLASSVITRGLDAIDAGHNPVAVKRGIERAVEVVMEELRRQARTLVLRDDVERVARASAHHDPAIGALIADAMDRVGLHGVVTVTESRRLETALEVVEGTRLDHGYLSPYFVSDPESMEAVLDNALVLLADLRLTEARELLPALEMAARAGRPLLVLAEDVEGEALATLVVNRLRGTVASVAVRAPFGGNRRRETLEDLAILTGATLYAPDVGAELERFEVEHFGRAQRVVVDASTTTITRGGGVTKTVRAHVDRLKRRGSQSDSNWDREWLKQRVERFAGGIAMVHVGGATEPERHERRSRVEDALAATRSAVEEGVVPGGGVALLRAQPALDSLRLRGDARVGIEIVRRAIEEPARCIAHNAGADGAAVVEEIKARSGAVGYDAVSGTFCDLEAKGIIDPAKVTRCALMHAARVGALVLTTDAIVVDTPEDEEPPAESKD